MTGYGKSIAELPNKKITIEIKSLNSKQFDLFTRIPQIYKEKEISIRNSLAKKLERGKIDFNLNVEIISNNLTAKIDHDIIKVYHSEIKKLAKELGISEPQDWFSNLLKLPDVIRQETEGLIEDEWLIIDEAISRAVDELTSFRRQEGLMLEKILNEKIENIHLLLVEIAPFEAERLEKIKDKIYEDLQRLENIDYDKNRFEQEMIYYIEKLDVNEEKNRLSNHLKFFIETMNDKHSQGKKLGFIAQEIGREINTLGSKSNHSEMQRIVVKMKDELEQIKEQILNVL
jgi:uncharacterized protein (TIGR00255 family)